MIVRRLLPGPIRGVLRRVRGLASAVRREAAGKVRAFRRYPTLRANPGTALRYLLLDREIDNFTYDISNRDELAQFLSNALGVTASSVRASIDELDGDIELRREIDGALARRRDRNARAPFGRRLGWYAAVRARRPQVVVETGVHDGLGSTVLLRALERNAEDGSVGVLLSFDIRSNVGWLVPGRLRGRHELTIGNPLTSLERVLAGRRIDVFIHDSDHRYDHEKGEFELALRHASGGAVLISDNAHASPALADFCAEHGLTYRYFGEAPVDHFYPGAGIGLTVVPVAT